MTRIMTWKKAYTISLAVHVVVAAVFVLLCAGAVIHHEPKMVVIDLDSSEPQSQGSGHAGGGGGGSAGQTLFPDKLSAADMEKRVEAVTENQSALRPQTPAAVPAVTPAADVPRQDAAPQAAASAPPSAPAADAGNGGILLPAAAVAAAKEREAAREPVTAVASAVAAVMAPETGPATARDMATVLVMDKEAATARHRVQERDRSISMDGRRRSMPIKIIRSWQSNGICRELSPFRRLLMPVGIAWEYLLQVVPGRVCSMMLLSVRPMPPAPIPIPRAAP